MRVSLVLGSGGARGYAHIGVIAELESRGHEVVVLSGCSMGALVGGVYAAGALPAFEEMVRGLSRSEVVRMVDPALHEPGLIKARRVMRLLASLVGEVRIEELPIPYTAVATDVLNRREVWFRRGPLLAAIRASIAIPTLFTPVCIDDRVLVDGGVLNPLPIEPSMHMASDITVAVSLMGRQVGLPHRPPTEESSEEARELSWISRVGEDVMETKLVRRIAELVPTGGQRPDKPELFQDLPSDLSISEVLIRSLDAMQGTIQHVRLGLNPPDVLIEVPSTAATGLDFHLAVPLIAMGRELAVKAFDEAGL